MITREQINEIDKAYYILEQRHGQIFNALTHRIFELETGWYSGHYSRIDGDKWHRDSYPIPVVSVKGLCDFEISFTKITVTAKLPRAKALAYSYKKLEAYSFEAYGVEDYLCDFFREGQSIDALKCNIAESAEKEIGFSFTFPFDADAKQLFEFAKLLRREGFYY